MYYPIYFVKGRRGRGHWIRVSSFVKTAESHRGKQSFSELDVTVAWGLRCDCGRTGHRAMSLELFVERQEREGGGWRDEVF